MISGCCVRWLALFYGLEVWRTGCFEVDIHMKVIKRYTGYEDMQDDLHPPHQLPCQTSN